MSEVIRGKLLRIVHSMSRLIDDRGKLTCRPRSMAHIAPENASLRPRKPLHDAVFVSSRITGRLAASARRTEFW